MKDILYIAAVLLSVARTFDLIPGIFASDSEDDHLHERFEISPHDADYDIATQTFTFIYHVHDDVVEGDIATSIWDVSCGDDDPGGTELTLATPGITSVSTSFDDQISEVTFAFTVDLSSLRDNPVVFTNLPAQQLAELKLCARFVLSASGFGGQTWEMNLLETIFIIEFDVSNGGFAVNDFNVGPKDRETTTQTESYDVVGYLCDRNDPTASLDGTGVLYNQGALISVCVTPTQDALDDGVVMESVHEFKWMQHNPSYLEQAAVLNGAPAMNWLTVLECVPGSIVCVISSVLFAEYYRIPLPEGNYVEGTGVAYMMFDPNRRRLEEEKNERRLQNDDGGGGGEIKEAEFDIVVQNVITENDAYGPLRAAGAGEGRSGRCLRCLLVSGFLLGCAIVLA
mmetsp:Transcript_7288/g.17771  ORF Transcript_7288/g.17771 Transcript_7288/m.17771 type:complete len:398 (+) Transcript_7288:190-1383(+)